MSTFVKSLVVVAGIAATVIACTEPQDSRTVGQKLDSAIDNAQRTGQDIGNGVAKAGSEAKESMKLAADAVAQSAADSAITSKLNLAFAADDHLKVFRINVDTRDGQVTLTGDAPDEKSRERATMLAGAIDGVRGVSNHLTVINHG